MPSDLAAEIRGAIEAAAGHAVPRPDRKFNKGDEYVSYGLKVPQFRAALRPFRPRIKALPLEGRLDLASGLLGEHIGELGHAGIHVLALGVRNLRPEHLDYLDSIAADFRGWSHVDDFCGSVLQPLLIAYPTQVLGLLDRWNASPERWKRRASVVAFTRSVGASGDYTVEALRLCENLVWDREDLVRKGVGWALKDAMRGDPETVLEYVKELRTRGVSSTITLYAIRDLAGWRRAEVLEVRAEGKPR